MSGSQSLVVGIDVDLDIVKTLDTQVGVTAITNATEGVVTTDAAHSYADGDFVMLCVPNGMTELDGQIARISNAAGSSLTLEGISTADMRAFSAAGSPYVQRITEWAAFDSALTYRLPQGDSVRLPSHTMHDRKQRQIFGMQGFTEGSLTCQTKIGDEAQNIIAAATRAGSWAGMRVTLRNGWIIAHNCEWSWEFSAEIDRNAISESTMEYTLVGSAARYTS